MKPMPASRIARSTRGGLGVDVDPERGQDVGRAGLRRQRAVAVLGDRHAAGRDHQRRRGRDVEGARTRRRRCRRCRSRRPGAATLTMRSRSAWAPPVSSSTVSPRTRSAIRKPPTWAGVASPDIMISNASRACSRLSALPRGDPAEQRLHPVRARCSRGGPEPRPCARKLRKQAMAVLGRDALGMELDAVDRRSDGRAP